VKDTKSGTLVNYTTKSLIVNDISHHCLCRVCLEECIFPFIVWKYKVFNFIFWQL